MGGGKTVLCVKLVKQELPEEWDDTMPLPGDIIEGLACEEDDDLAGESFIPAQGRSEFTAQLGKIASQRKSEVIWVKVRRGENVVKIKARVVPEKGGMLHRKFTIQAATDDRHVAVLRELNLDECTELQGKSFQSTLKDFTMKVVNVNGEEFHRRGMKYNWKRKLGTYLPDPRSPIISSILFTPFVEESTIEATTARSMAWFSAAVSSGAPLVFVNIQTEQLWTPDKNNPIAREISWGRQQTLPTNFHIVQGIRLWFLPGIAEVSIGIMPRPEETRFGMDIKRTEEGFICIYSVALGSAAERAGLGHLHEEANAKGHLLVISRLEGKSVMPSSVCSSGLINCCNHNDIRDVLTQAIERTEGIRIHIMAWPNQARLASPRGMVSTLQPPSGFAPPPSL
ncbi:hypothetical protein CDL15_Pgr022089 [Punica granatum]|uniref:Uncharacterized protein n=1 Tax=Punica granatum TaxID=22663 RepID=A0A218VS18_PUNGR|nr:hypothetical protein CDL15_Pgr022089 [Punica granatum]